MASTSRRVGVLFDGVWLADTLHAKYVWEDKYFPHFCVPLADVKCDYVDIFDEPAKVLGNGDFMERAADPTGMREMALACKVVAREVEEETENCVFFKEGPLRGLVKFEFEDMGEAM